MKDFKNQITLTLVKRDKETYNLEDLNKKIIEKLTDAFHHVLILQAEKTSSINGELQNREVLLVNCNFNDLTEGMKEAVQEAIILEMTEGKEDVVELKVNNETQLLYKENYIENN
ncbi:hypothetical protein FP435_03775 [Lactobacillus sp. PV037]|uniref:hypothetical protein n=1 Tax=unclassified Lactobacillus TaxID=2620435 RepID=UPI00223F0051|nr:MULTISPECIES: hypothetical protein [unclassified Lactobacillus]QNQ82267.1 hypothetical protein FP433_04055 [Lactobacillus sp. PV012]QNQ83622.1 hypothetical protein FP435_03775 [Lactobacillus sp. PV037]